MSLDPITLSVIQAGLQQVCDEMDLSFSRAAFSPVIAEANDRSDGIYAAEDGALIAQGAGGLPVFVGTMQYSTAELIRLIGYHATHNMSKLSVVGVMFPDDDPNYLSSLRQFGALTKLEHDNCDDVYCPVWVFRPSEDAVEQYQARVAEFALVGKDGSVNATESLANSSTFQGLTAVPM